MSIISTHDLNFLYDLTATKLRHRLRWLYIDLLIFCVMFENGLLIVLVNMSVLDEVGLVVEYGRVFRGSSFFVDVALERRGLRWVGGIAQDWAREGRKRLGVIGREKSSEREQEKEGMRSLIRFRCVFMTRRWKDGVMRS